jgi:amino acid transporter
MKYLYYTLYRNLLKVKINSIPAYSAILLMMLFEFFNIFTVLQLFPVTLQIFPKTKNEGELSYVVVGIILLIINYFLLYKNVANLSHKYRNESEKKKLRGTILLCCYAILSVVSLLWTMPV